MVWNHDYFTDEHRMLTRHDLDDITTDYPLVFERACGHVLTANTPALRLAGVTRDTVAPEGGAIDRDPDGEPNGIIRENARPQVRAILGKHDVDDTEKLLRIAMAHAAETGVTSVQTNDLRGGSWETVLEAYNRTQLNPTVRVYHQVNFPNPEDYRAFLERGYTTNRGTPFHRFGPLKLFVDGSLGARMRAFNGKIAPLDKIAAHRAHDRALFPACQTAQFINLPLVAAVEGIIFAYYTKYPHGSPLKAVTKELRFVKFTCLCEKSCYNIFCIELYIRSI